MESMQKLGMILIWYTCLSRIGDKSIMREEGRIKKFIKKRCIVIAYKKIRTGGF